VNGQEMLEMEGYFFCERSRVMNMRNCRWVVPVWFVFLFVLAGCEREQPPTAGPPEEGGAVRAGAELKPTEGSRVSGTVTFVAADGKLRVVADLQGLEPGKHGFHIHEKGDCSAPDASSAGGHFNPVGTPHGAQTDPAEKRHVGDLGNVEADADGKAHLELTDQIIALEGENSIVGKAVVVHAKADDLTSQPTGDAGGRLACGVIEIQK
jgi:Cu-Zn family superoxide dismutase